MMNNIQEDDWADDTWSRHSGMYSVDKKPVTENPNQDTEENSEKSTEDELEK